MKLLLIVDRLDRSTLCESAWWTWDVAAQSAAGGHRVEVVSLSSADTDDLPPGVLLAADPDPNLALAAALQNEPDVVHLATPGPFGPHVVEILRGQPLLVDVNGHWPVCPQNDLMRRPQFTRCDLRYPADACAACAGFERMREMDTRLRLVSRAAVVVAHAPFQAERLRTLLDRPVELVNYGVDTQRFRPDPEPPLSDAVSALWANRSGGRRVLFLGPPAHARGIDYLLDLMIGVRARVPGASFVVTGTDPDNPGWRSTFNTELGELGLTGQALVIPRVLPDDLPALLASCDLGISPAPWDDAGGLFVQQALAAGLPTVTSGRGVLASLGEHGSGMLASPDTPAIFSDRVAMLLLHPAARAAMADAARLNAVEHHDRGLSLDTMAELHRRVAGEEMRRAA